MKEAREREAKRKSSRETEEEGMVKTSEWRDKKGVLTKILNLIKNDRERDIYLCSWLSRRKTARGLVPVL